VGIAALTALATGLALAGAGLPVLGPDAYGRYAWSLLICRSRWPCSGRPCSTG
jgi:hypothetical protein